MYNLETFFACLLLPFTKLQSKTFKNLRVKTHIGAGWEGTLEQSFEQNNPHI